MPPSIQSSPESVFTENASFVAAVESLKPEDVMTHLIFEKNPLVSNTEIKTASPAATEKSEVSIPVSSRAISGKSKRSRAAEAITAQAEKAGREKKQQDAAAGQVKSSILEAAKAARIRADKIKPRSKHQKPSNESPTLTGSTLFVFKANPNDSQLRIRLPLGEVVEPQQEGPKSLHKRRAQGREGIIPAKAVSGARPTVSTGPALHQVATAGFRLPPTAVPGITGPAR